MNTKVCIEKNQAWDCGGEAPYFTIITPIYNMRATLERTIRSIENQSCGDWEYILVDDGSTEDCDGIATAFMNRTSHPVMYMKKANGGVHTARNLGYQNARGTLLITLDADDELVENALETLIKTWETIPKEDRSKYREIVTQCMTEEGKRVGEPFPEDINEKPWEEARRICYATKGEHMGCNVAKVLRENPFPEPEGVTFVTENILWKKLDMDYCAYYINDMLRVYHQEGDNHLSRIKKKTIQTCRNTLYNNSFMLNHPQIYGGGLETA